MCFVALSSCSVHVAFTLHPTQEAGGRPLEDEYGYRTTLDDPQHRKLTLEIVSANVEDND